MVNALPTRDETLPVIGPLAVLALPARVTHIQALELVLLVEKDGVVGLGIHEMGVASLATVGPRLNVPFVH